MIRKQLVSYLRRPASFNGNRRATVIVSAALVFFVLFVFAPFGLDGVDGMRRALLSGGFALVTAVAAVTVNCLLPILFRRFYLPESWTAGRYLLNNMIVLLAIIVGNYVFAIIVFGLPQGVWLQFLLVCIVMTCQVGIIPVLVLHFYAQAYSLKRHLEEARTMNRLLSDRIASGGDQLQAADIVIGSNSRDPMQICLSDIICLESSANYVRVSYLRDGIPCSRLLRTTLAKVAAELDGSPQIMRCHCAFMVNVLHIYNVEGNSQGLRLQLRDGQLMVPVSRAYIKDVLKAIRP
ncbi:MAG: LytTR family transcriptional regulator [Tannerellaceae bacterium]|jgi:hypothetical protein|nr:LytTR family transcriptional regulator [Tannerellaceae bacterium]